MSTEARENKSAQRYVVVRDYQSGYTNELLCIQIAVGLAASLDRTLVFHGRNGLNAPIKPIHGGSSAVVPERRWGIVDSSRIPTILDLIEPLPVPSIQPGEFLEIEKDFAAEDHRTVNTALFEAFLPSDGITSADTHEFGARRAAIRNSDHAILRFALDNFALPSRFFHAPREAVKNAINSVCLADPYRALSRRVAEAIGTFNAAHLRLTDFRHQKYPGFEFWLPPNDQLYLDISLPVLCAHFDPAMPLVIGTDEPDNEPLISAIKARFPKLMLVEDFILEQFRNEFLALPFQDEVTLAAIAQDILGQAQDFIGTPLSTFSAHIHKLVHRRGLNKGKPFKYLFSGFPPDSVAFVDGIYQETLEGRYSWNRLELPVPTGYLSWIREWPEAIEPRPGDKAELVPGSADTFLDQLEDVALGRPCRQSSMSQWSAPDDPERAVSGQYYPDFAFHTDTEDSPWWEVDLGSQRSIEAVRITNRRLMCFDRAHGLRIWTRLEPDAPWEPVESPGPDFSDLPEPEPMIATLDGQMARFIKLDIPGHNCLHLARVEVFARP